MNFSTGIPLGKLASIKSGFAYKSSWFSADGTNLIRIGDIQDGTIEGINCAKIKSDVLLDHKMIRAEAGDLLVALSGATTGKVGLVPEELAGSLVNQRIAIVRPVDTATGKLIFSHLRRPKVKAELLNRSGGSAQPNLSPNILSDFLIPLPPEPDRSQAAQILDKADALRHKRQEAIRLSEQFLRSVFLEMFGDPVSNTNKFREVELGAVLSRIDSGDSPVCFPQQALENEWGVLKLGAVTSGVYRSEANKALPSSEIPNPLNEVRAGDLLFSRKNTYELVGACAYVWHTRSKLLLPDLIFRFVVDPTAKVLPYYLWGILNSPSFRSRIEKLAGGSAGSMPNISKGRLEKLRIPIAPLPLQEQYFKLAESTQRFLKQVAISSSVIELLHRSLAGTMFNDDPQKGQVNGR